jgi:hypothetical protein
MFHTGARRIMVVVEVPVMGTTCWTIQRRMLRRPPPVRWQDRLSPFTITDLRVQHPDPGVHHEGSKHQIPIRTFAEWDDARPRFLEVDLVAHCGTSTEGFSLHTLCAVDIATCWVELDAVWGKGQVRVGGAVHHVQERLPIPLRGLDSDNGSEFINRILYDYCQR